MISMEGKTESMLMAQKDIIREISKLEEDKLKKKEELQNQVFVDEAGNEQSHTFHLLQKTIAQEEQAQLIDNELKIEEGEENVKGIRDDLKFKTPKQIFEEFDTDGSGLIDFDEFRACLPALGMNISIPKALRYFRMCDGDGSGEIDVEEFQMALFTADPDNGNPVGFIPNEHTNPIDVFEMFDEDNSGEIDEDEFYFVLEYLGITATDKQLEELWNKFDDDQSGYIKYDEFKQMWLELIPVRKELLARKVDVPKFASIKKMRQILDAHLEIEETKESHAMAEAKRWFKWKNILRKKEKRVVAVEHRAQNELRNALDVGGMVFVFGQGAYSEFIRDSHRSMGFGNFNPPGADLIADTWHKRVRPGEALPVKKKNKEAIQEELSDDEDDQDEFGLMCLGVVDPYEEAKRSKFKGVKAALNTYMLWGRRVKQCSVSNSTILAVAELGEMYSWGGKDHWWHRIEPASYWQNRWRGNTTERSKLLLTTDKLLEPKDDRIVEIPVDEQEEECEKLKHVAMYFDKWKPPRTDKFTRLVYIQKRILPEIDYNEAKLSLEVRCLDIETMTKHQMCMTLFKDFELEKKMLGEKAHRRIRELELQIRDLMSQKSTGMVNDIKLLIQDEWRPLRDIRVEEEAELEKRDEVRMHNRYIKEEKEYLKWREYIVGARQDFDNKFTPRGNSLVINVGGITRRGTKMVTPRGYQGVTFVASGSNHNCAIHLNGQLYSWGVGIGGRLGLDLTQDGNNNQDVGTPTLIQAFNGMPIIDVSCGYSHTCAVTANGDVFAMGSAQNGKLGLAEWDDKSEYFCSVPTRISFLNDKKIKKISCGSSHTGAISVEGRLFMWGVGDGGRLGLGRDMLGVQKVPVLCRQMRKETMHDISCGNSHTIICTVTKNVWQGEGINRMKNKVGGDVFVAGPPNILGKFCYSFEKVTSLKQGLERAYIVQVAAGLVHSAILDQNGALYTWGVNRNGSLGLDTDEGFIGEPTVVKCLYEPPYQLAIGRPSIQSSTYGTQYPDFGNDGKIDTENPKLCTCTQQDPQAWWQVDLGELCTIQYIKLWNRTDSRPGLDPDKFSSRLFPVWIMIAQEEFDTEMMGDKALNKALSKSVAKKKFVHDRKCNVWKLPENVLGRYIRVQLVGFNFLHFAQLEVMGLYGMTKYPGRVSNISAGPDVTVAVLPPSGDPNDCETAYKRAVFADSRNADILRNYETFIPEYDKWGRGEGLKSCPICGESTVECEICLMKKHYEDELSLMALGPGGARPCLEEIKHYLFHTGMPKVKYTDIKKYIPPTLKEKVQRLANKVNPVYIYKRKKRKKQKEKERMAKKMKEQREEAKKLEEAEAERQRQIAEEDEETFHIVEEDEGATPPTTDAGVSLDTIKVSDTRSKSDGMKDPEMKEDPEEELD